MQKKEFEELQKCISIFNVAHQLNLEVIERKGNEFFAICPFCGYRSKTIKANMKLNYIKNSYHCFDCGKSGYAIGLYATLRNLDNKSAFKELLEKEAFSCDKSEFVFDTNNKIADLNYRDTVYRSLLNTINLKNDHKKKLEDLGLTESYIEDYNFKSIPTKKFASRIISYNLSKNFDLAGIPGFFQNEEFKWDFTPLNGIFIPVYSSTNKIKGLSILLDKTYNGTNNIWFSSNNKINGTPAENWLMSFNIKEDTHTIILTDDFITAHNLNLGLKVPILAFSSIQNSKNLIKQLKNTNIKKIIFTVRLSDETQKIDYLIEKLLSGLLDVGYDIEIKTYFDIESMYDSSVLEMFNNNVS